MGRMRLARIAGLAASLLLFAIACSSASEATAPAGVVRSGTTATPVVVEPSPTPRPRTGPTPRGDGSPTPIAYRPEIRALIRATGPTETESGLTVEDVLRRSREHAEAAVSFRYRQSAILPQSHQQEPDVTTHDYTEYIRPDRSRSVSSDGVPQMIIVGGTSYRLSSNSNGKWWKVGTSDEPFPPEFFPTTFIPFDLAGASFTKLDDPDHYFIEGYASPLTRSDAVLQGGSDLLKLTELKIRKSDFAFLGSTSWGLPLLVEDGQVLDETALLVRQAQIKAGPPDVGAEFFDYNVDIDIQHPEEWFAGVISTNPRPERSVPINPEISYTITQPVEIEKISISPPVELSPDREIPLSTGAINRIYKPAPPLEYETEYTVTLEWGTSQEDMQSISWSFMTVRNRGLRNE